MFAKTANGSSNQNTPTEIVGIQFGMMSPDEIRRTSVAEITSRETYVNNKPVIGGLFDPRMGVLEPGLICPTDGLDYLACPGYFGHLELACTLFYAQYISTIQKISKCICCKCGRILLDKEKYGIHALKHDNLNRWKYVYDTITKYVKPTQCKEIGCGARQPIKIRKEKMTSIFFDYADQENPILMSAEMLLKLFRRIPDDDITFMGFCPIWARPEWMFTDVMLIPPPAVRPSVKFDAQQRSEDDLTHGLINIIKANKDLAHKIDTNAKKTTIDDVISVLQLFFTSIVDNHMPGTNPVSQRSGRPYKAIKERLNGKTGRVRGNLMGKRVDFSARSVITADPNLSIREVGVPLKIAKTVTKPVIVNDKNRDFLTKLAQNGPEYPGATMWEQKNGDMITLKYFDRNSIILENGDTLHRHMLDGDPVIFNRQPTLHRMSMMCHEAKIMFVGDTFRLNVADTKPYNADFDGDEMNLHMPQHVESDSELKNLAGVVHQIISPGTNSPIIGIYQDSMLGSYRFTRPDISFTLKDTMNLLMMFNRVDLSRLISDVKMNGRISNFQILSQILPPMSLKISNKQLADDEDKLISNNIVEVRNGDYLRGQLDKGTLGSGSKGLIHRICSDFGNMAASNFIDDLQNIITEYMKTSSFSVGISDLITSKKTDENIVNIITEKKKEVADLMKQIRIGIFDNTGGRSTKDEFEMKVTNILNRAQSDAGRAALTELNKDNRFVTMFNAGSKGSEINIQQMTSCLGQQVVDNRRIPYGFDNRTLPHFQKYDDSPPARGFVESSYINGLNPQELYFHAMGGRIGLIDTAVKTSSTGYIQRRLIKGMENLMVQYDMTVRMSNKSIVQFTYGNDSIDSVKIENQILPIANMSIGDIYAHYSLPEDGTEHRVILAMFVKNALARSKKQREEWKITSKKYTDYLIAQRTNLIKNVFAGHADVSVKAPVSFANIIDNVSGQLNINANSLVDITMLEMSEMMEETYRKLSNLGQQGPPSQLFRTLFVYYLSPKVILIKKRFNRRAVELLMETILLTYKRSLIAPGEMVGIIAGQSIGEPSTQMTLNTFHLAGVATKSNVTRGIPRLEEVLSLSTELKMPSDTVYLLESEETSKSRAIKLATMLEYIRLEQIVKSAKICFDPVGDTTTITEDSDILAQYQTFEKMMDNCADTAVVESDMNPKDKSKWISRLTMDPRAMLEQNITMDDVNFALVSAYNNDINCVFSDYNSDDLVFRIRMANVKAKNSSTKGVIDQSDQIYVINNFQEQQLNNTVLRGIKGISRANIRTIKDTLVETAGNYKKQDIWVIDTVGTNLLDLLALDYIDSTRTYSNSTMEVYSVLGIEATRQSIYDEISEIIEHAGAYVNYRHMELLADRMTYREKPIAIGRFGINNDNIEPIAKASFEETPEMFMRAARHGELDTMRGISANIMCGQEGMYGTSSFKVHLDLEEFSKLEVSSEDSAEIDELVFDGLGDTNRDAKCGTNALTIDNNSSNIRPEALGGMDDYNPFV